MVRQRAAVWIFVMLMIFRMGAAKLPRDAAAPARKAALVVLRARPAGTAWAEACCRAKAKAVAPTTRKPR